VAVVIYFVLISNYAYVFILLPCSQDEERLRAIYEKQFKRLKTLDNLGAESSKIDATRASIRKLQTKINICIRTAETIMGRIHKLRDNELQPQLAALINGYQIASLIHYANFCLSFLINFWSQTFKIFTRRYCQKAVLLSFQRVMCLVFLLPF